MIRTVVRESPKATMVRFFEAMEEKIRDRVDLMQYNDIHELLHQAECAECWVLEKQAAEIVQVTTLRDVVLLMWMMVVLNRLLLTSW
jgi:hypothetical protein